MFFVSLSEIGPVEVEISLMKVGKQPFLQWSESREMLIFVIPIAIEELW